jgi:phosphoribosyl 1,2-cyclic phosphodiesterase
MLNFCSLYSGSSGNCLFVETENTKLLIDSGVSLKKIEEGLRKFRCPCFHFKWRSCNT